MNVTSRREANQLMYNYPYPKFRDNLENVYEQVFINSGGEPTPALAKNHLYGIQEQHPRRLGWVCEIGHEGVFQDTDGLWYAFRHHAKYR